MADVEQPLAKRPRVEDVTTTRNITTSTTQLGEMATLVARPQQLGTKGYREAAVTNQYELKIDPTTQFFQYEAFVKEINAKENDPVGLTKNIVQSVLNKSKERFENSNISVFAPNLVISGTKLKDPETSEAIDEIQFIVDVPKPNERRKREFEIHLRLTRSAPQFGQFYNEYLQNPTDHANEMFAMRTSMNVIFHAGQRERALTTKGQWHFTKTGMAELSPVAVMYRSWTQAVVDSAMGMILTFGTSVGCFKKEMYLKEYLKNSQQNGKYNWSAFEDRDSVADIQKIDRFLKKEKIKCTFWHQKRNQSKKPREPETIKGLAFTDQGRVMKVRDVEFLTKDAEYLVKRMQRTAKEANGGERTDEINLEAIKEALASLHENNSLKVNPPPEEALASLFAEVAGGADKVDILKMVHRIAPPVSMIQYFKRVYGIDLDPRETVVWTGSAKKKSFHYLPHAMMEAGQPKQKIDGPEADKMITLNKQKPAERKGLIKGMKQEADYDHDKTLREFHIQVNSEPIVIEDARVLPVPRITVTEGDPKSPDSRLPVKGSWDHRGRLYNPVSLKSWAVLITDTRGFNHEAVNSFLFEMKALCQEKGIRWSEPALVEDLQTPIRGSLENEIKEFVKAAEKKIGMPLELLIVMKAPDGNNGVYYSEIKRVGDMELGIATTCCNSKKANLQRNNGRFKKDYCKGVVLKINAKLGSLTVPIGGGERGDEPLELQKSINWAVTIPWKASKTMVVGIDVSHPSPGSRQPSVLAITSLVDEFGHRYLCRYKTCARRMEIGGVADDDFQAMIGYLIKQFAIFRDGPPESILIFRDGVSESQFAQVKQIEVQAFKDVAARLADEWADMLKGKDWSPKITYVVCQKRNQARFMPKIDDHGRGSGNLPAGFVVDTRIVSKSLFDFYLISHCGLQGVSRPVHYFVLEDQMRYSADEIQGITYALCYGYSRCTKSIGCVTPIYYADKIAERVRMYYHESEDLMSDAGTISSRTSDQQPPTKIVHKNLQMCMFWT